MSLASPKCAGLSFVSVIFVSMLATSVYFIVNASERRTYMLSSNCTATGVDIVATKDHCARKRASCRYVYTPYWNVTYRRNDDMIVKAVGVCAYGCGSFPSRIAASSFADDYCSIGEKRICYYDPSNPVGSVEWGEPSLWFPGGVMLLMLCSFVGCILCCIGCQRMLLKKERTKEEAEGLMYRAET